MNDALDFNKPKTALIIEDSPTQATNTQAVLQQAGLRVLCAINGITGVRLASQVHPDLIILDVQLPDINGFEVCAQLKQDKDTAAIPVILLTRHDSAENLQHGAELGAVEFIPKDAFATAVLVETIRQMGLI